MIGWRPSSAEVARLRTPVTRVEGARSFRELGWLGTHFAEAARSMLTVGLRHEHRMGGAWCGRGGACGLVDREGGGAAAVTQGSCRSGIRRCVLGSMCTWGWCWSRGFEGEQIDELENAIDEKLSGGWIVSAHVASRCSEVIELRRNSTK